MKDTFVVNLDRGLDTEKGHAACFDVIEGDASLMPWKKWLEQGYIVPAESEPPKKSKLTKDAVVTAEEK